MIADLGFAGEVDLAFEIFDDMRMTGVPPTITTYNRLLGVCEKVWVGLGWVGIWVGLGWVDLGFGLGWVGLGSVGLGWVGLFYLVWFGSVWFYIGAVTLPMACWWCARM